jgi:RND superfamily putative drug exporter
VAAAVRHVAPAITAAGLVLAVSFATLVLAPDPGTRETGFALAVGILIAALVASSVLVPSLAALPVRRRAPSRSPSATQVDVP